MIPINASLIFLGINLLAMSFTSGQKADLFQRPIGSNDRHVGGRCSSLILSIISQGLAKFSADLHPTSIDSRYLVVPVITSKINITVCLKLPKQHELFTEKIKFDDSTAI